MSVLIWCHTLHDEIIQPPRLVLFCFLLHRRRITLAGYIIFLLYRRSIAATIYQELPYVIISYLIDKEIAKSLSLLELLRVRSSTLPVPEEDSVLIIPLI